MVQHRFEKIVNRACSYYEHRQPKDGTMDIWAEKTAGIPDAAADYIEAHITDNEQFPKNLPNLMWALFRAWQAANPDKVRREKEYFECPECHEGIIYARKKGYRYIFRCVTCKQNRVQSYPKAYKSELEAQGYTIENPDGGYLNQEEKVECVKKMRSLGIRLPASFTAERVTNTPF